MIAELTAGQQVVVGLSLAAPSAAIGYLAYKRSRKVDALSAQTGAASENRAGMSEIREGQNDLIANLQADNKSLREIINSQGVRIDACFTLCDGLKKEVARLHKLHGDEPNGEP